MLAPDPRFTELDALGGPEFEVALVELFGILGFEDVQRIGGFDKGADIVCVRDGVRVAVQAKRRSTAVDIGAVRQLLDGMKRYDCARGIVVTNSFFSKPAIECAQFHGIELWDRPVLANYLNGEAPDVDTSVCAVCGAGVTKGVTEWCLSQPWRYLGVVYCRRHQPRRNRTG